VRKSRIPSGLEAESIGIMRGVVAEFRNPVVDEERLPLKHDERQEMRLVRFRNLGCYLLTGAIESSSATLAEIVAELRKARRSER
jgi:3'-phosphoadenosine 5'-phosphosulfate sulfotransferase (PAPS reductase)/FAD synthetase